MKANKRVRDLNRRSHTGVRITIPVEGTYYAVTDSKIHPGMRVTDTKRFKRFDRKRPPVDWESLIGTEVEGLYAY